MTCPEKAYSSSCLPFVFCANLDSSNCLPENQAVTAVCLHLQNLHSTILSFGQSNPQQIKFGFKFLLNSPLTRRLLLTFLTRAINMINNITVNTVNTTQWPNAGLILAHLLRRLPNIKTTMGRCLVFATLLYLSPILLYRLSPDVTYMGGDFNDITWRWVKRNQYRNLNRMDSPISNELYVRNKYKIYTHCYNNVGQPSTTLAQHWYNIRSISNEQYVRNKHKASTQCYNNVGQPSTTLAQHWYNIGSSLMNCM